MIYFTPKNDLSLLQAYDAAMEEMFAKANALLVQQKHRAFEVDPDLERIRLDLERRKSWVNEAAHRYGCRPPWDESLVRSQHLHLHLSDVDPLVARSYRGKINYLLGRVEHTKEKDLAKVRNPFEWPSAVFVWLFVPIIRGISPKLGEGTKNAFEGFSKQLGGLMAFVVVGLLFWPFSGHSLASVLKGYIMQQLGMK